MALTITGLSKTYPNGVRALKDLSLTIGNNMFGLLGPNGAGKSSLMRTVATLQDPDSGAIDLDGLNVLTQKERGPQTPRIPATGVRCLPPHVRRLTCSITSPSSKASPQAGERREMVDALLHQTNLWDVSQENPSPPTPAA